MYEKTFPPPFGAFSCDLCCGSFYITSSFFLVSLKLKLPVFLKSTRPLR